LLSVNKGTEARTASTTASTSPERNCAFLQSFLDCSKSFGLQNEH